MITKNKKQGFTLAEVLITLVVIGIIAAITVPTIMANSRKNEVETKLKQTYSILNNALTRAVTDNGPIYTWDEMGVSTSLRSTAFFSKYLQPYLMLNKNPGNYSAEALGYKTDTYYSDGKSVLQPKTEIGGRTIFNNGVVLLGLTGNAVIKGDDDYLIYGIILRIDINGPKGKNTFGRDIFEFVLYTAGDTHVCEMLGVHKITDDSFNLLYETGTGYVQFEKQDKNTIINSCKNVGSECGALIQNNGWKIPKDYPINI